MQQLLLYLKLENISTFINDLHLSLHLFLNPLKNTIMNFRLFYLIGIISLFFSSKGYCQVSPCLVSSGLVSGFCFSTGDPIIESPCIAGIQKQIARSVNAENLAEWITKAKCGGWIGVNGTPYDEALVPNGDVPVNCVPPYDRCYGRYCPDKYCSIIKSFVDMKASFILRAANTWGNHLDLQPGTPFYQGMKQIVIDINAAYDCAGLRRPVIQGTIFENIDDAVSGVPIPADVINAFKTTVGFDNAYYLDGSGLPKVINFNPSRLRKIPTSVPWPNSPDITRIESKMWFYYLSKMYIDFGYKSIHLGQMTNWAEYDPSYIHTTIILNKIRAYAQSKNTFVLLSEENKKAAKFPGTNTFMYDFDSRPLFPREISNPSVCGEYNCTNTPTNYLPGTPCSNETFPAVIDQCIMTGAGNSSGISPLSGCSLPFQPFSTYFDFGKGMFDDTHPPSAGCNGFHGVWGWDDARWFAEGISSQNCRVFWMQDAICRMRQYYNGFGFVAAPGILYTNRPENMDKFLTEHTNPTSDGRYLLTDEVLVKNAIISSWTVNQNPEIVSDYTCGSAIIGKCSQFNLDKKVRTYHFSISNPDCTSSYSWHVKTPNNTWLEMTYGSKRDIAVTTAGVYTIYLRIDNLGLPGGVKQIAYEQLLEPFCCITPAGVAPAPAMAGLIKNLGETFEELPLNQNNDLKPSYVLSDNDDDRDVVAFPSPTSSIFTVKAKTPAYSACSLVIKDITGRTIVESDMGIDLNAGWSITCKNWANGVYFINITSAQGAHTVLKIVKF